MTENMRGAVFMMASMAGFALNDALVKTVSDTLSLFQAIMIRGLVATALIAILAAATGALAVRLSRGDGRMLSWRCVGEIGATFCFLTALFNMPIADATAILQSVPLAIALGAALFLGEPIGWRRYLAIAIGFVGVLIIVRPGGEGFNAYAIWAVAAVGFIMLRDLSTRNLSPAAPTFFVTLVTSAALTAAGAGMTFATGWSPVGLPELSRLGLSGLALTGAYLFMVQAMRTGAVGFTQPFRYTLLPWAILFGILFFAEYPDMPMLAGSAIVIATGLFTFYRERVVARRAMRAASAATAAERRPTIAE